MRSKEIKAFRKKKERTVAADDFSGSTLLPEVDCVSSSTVGQRMGCGRR